MKLLILVSALFYAVDSENTVNSISISSTLFTKTCNNANEVPVACYNKICQKTCINPNPNPNPNYCIDPPLFCTPGCDCAPGYLRNSNNICVLPQECDARPACYGANEQFSFCGDDNCQRTCTRLDVSTCVPKCNNGACVCAADFVKNSVGACILPADCPTNPTPMTCTGANEMFSSCGDDGCQRSCTKLDVDKCISICSTPGCICATGFVRNAAGACVLPNTCPTPISRCTKANEQFSECGNDSCQRSCTRFDVRACIPNCSTGGCVCNVGFVRNSEGLCVLPSTCPPLTCGKANEVFDYCGDNGCEPTCRRPDVTTCTARCSFPACICTPGFVRNSQGNCVRPADCSTTECIKPNERFVDCGDDGCQRSCTRLDVSTCDPVCSNIPACLCSAGFVRNAAGDCVTVDACPTTCTGQNEEFSMCNANKCQVTCRKMSMPPMINCPCTPGCVCKMGFFRNSAGVCVAAADCNACPQNEEFKICEMGVCEGTCAMPNKGTDPNCSSATECTSKCFCKPGQVRGPSGQCIPMAQCPRKK